MEPYRLSSGPVDANHQNHHETDSRQEP